MTPEERKLVAELFDRLAALEDQQRDAEAERLIKDGLRQAPNAVYALVQNVLVQEEALKESSRYIRELEDALGIQPEAQPRRGGFLDTVRETFSGRREPQGSVPSVRSGDAPMGAPEGYRGGAPAGPYGNQQPASQGGSFLGTAAAAMAGTIGGMLLGRMLGGGHDAHASPSRLGGSGSPWGGGGEAANSNLAREAGLDDIGRGRAGRDEGGGGGERGFGLFDSSGSEQDANGDFAEDDDLGDDGDFDGGGFDGGGDGGD
jgi:hypothetical protein